MRLDELIGRIEELKPGYSEPNDYISTYAEVIKFNGEEGDLTFENRQKQGSVDVKMIIELTMLNKQIIFEERIFEAYGDIKQYLNNSDFYNLNNNDNIINAFNEYEIPNKVVQNVIKAARRDLKLESSIEL